MRPNQVQFRCKRSGNVVSFSNEIDIEQLRSHEGYEEVTAAKEVTSSSETVEIQKKRGRPRK